MRFAYTMNPNFAEAVHQFTLTTKGGYTIEEINRLFDEVKEWCVSTFPERQGVIRFYYSSWTIWVVRENDAFQFRMRWC